MASLEGKCNGPAIATAGIHQADRMPFRRRLTAIGDLEETVRTFVKLAGVAGALALAACSGNEQQSSDFQKDLERASTASEITLPTAQPATQVVSAIERTAPGPKKVQYSQRVAKHKPAPTRVQAPVEVTTETAVEATPVAPEPAPVQEATIPSPRPQPVAQGGGDIGEGSIGRGGRGDGIGIGTVIGVILRGGVVDGDDCDPRSERGRRPTSISINNRIPVIGTFPGSGRIGGGRSRF